MELNKRIKKIQSSKDQNSRRAIIEIMLNTVMKYIIVTV